MMSIQEYALDVNRTVEQIMKICDKYNIKYEDEILNAIIYHTTGRPNMTLLEKIVFVADYIEPGRYKQNRLQEIREMAFNDLDESIRMILSDTLEHLKSKKYAINPITEETYNYYVGEKH